MFLLFITRQLSKDRLTNRYLSHTQLYQVAYISIVPMCLHKSSYFCLSSVCVSTWPFSLILLIDLVWSLRATSCSVALDHPARSNATVQLNCRFCSRRQGLSRFHSLLCFSQKNAALYRTSVLQHLSARQLDLLKGSQMDTEVKFGIVCI